MLEVGDLLTLNDNQEYLVIKQIYFKGKNYVYLITKDGISDVLICSYEEDKLKIVTEELLFEKLLNLFNE